MVKPHTAPPPATFVGYVSEAGGKLPQEWFDGLPIEDRDEIRDTVNYLISIPIIEWRRPEVDKVAHPIVEIRIRGKDTGHTIRIYGAFSEEVRAQFVILNTTTDKKKGHDKDAQDLAIKRLAHIKAGKASIYEFSFKERTDRESEEKSKGAGASSGIKSDQRNRLPNQSHQK